MPSRISKFEQSNRLSYGFGLLLLSLVGLILLPAHFQSGIDNFFHITFVLTSMLLAFLFLVSKSFRLFVLGVCIAVPALLTSSWQGYLVPQMAVIVNSALQIIFLVFISGNVLFYLFESDVVSINMIFAALCLYLLIGITWTFIYMILEMIQPASFSNFADSGPTRYDTIEQTRDAFSRLAYFSFVTLTSLGYGDIQPLSKIARSWVMIEAILGQFYMAVVLARLVGLFVGKKSR